MLALPLRFSTGAKLTILLALALSTVSFGDDPDDARLVDARRGRYIPPSASPSPSPSPSASPTADSTVRILGRDIARYCARDTRTQSERNDLRTRFDAVPADRRGGLPDLSDPSICPPRDGRDRPVVVKVKEKKENQNEKKNENAKVAAAPPTGAGGGTGGSNGGGAGGGMNGGTPVSFFGGAKLVGGVVAVAPGSSNKDAIGAPISSRVSLAAKGPIKETTPTIPTVSAAPTAVVAAARPTESGTPGPGSLMPPTEGGMRRGGEAANAFKGPNRKPSLQEQLIPNYRAGARRLTVSGRSRLPTIVNQSGGGALVNPAPPSEAPDMPMTGGHHPQ